MSILKNQFTLEGKGGSGGKNLSVEKKAKKFELIPFIFCLILAIVIWILVYNYTDDSITKTYTLPIEKTGLEYLNEEGFSVYGVSATNVTIELKGTNRDIKHFEENLGSAYINLSYVTEADEYIVTPTIDFPKGSGLEITEMEPKYVNVIIDRQIEKTVPFVVSVGEISKDPNVVRAEPFSDVSEILISGPQRTVDQIEKAIYTIKPVGIVSESLVISGFSPEFFNGDGELVEINQFVKFDTSEIKVKLNVTALKKVPIRIVSENDVNDYQLILGENGKIISDVTLSGESSELASVNEFIIVVPDSNLGVFEIEIKSNPAIPETVTVEELGEMITVEATPKKSAENPVK